MKNEFEEITELLAGKAKPNKTKLRIDVFFFLISPELKLKICRRTLWDGITYFFEQTTMPISVMGSDSLVIITI